MPDQRGTIALFARDMARLLAAVEAASTVDPGATTIDNWRVKDLLAHIAAWDRELVRAVDDLLAGRALSSVFDSTDEFNARAVKAAAGISLDAVRAEAEAAHRDLLATIERLPPDRWETDSGRRWRSGTAITPASLFTYEYKAQTHYAGHASEIEAVVARREFRGPAEPISD